MLVSIFGVKGKWLSCHFEESKELERREVKGMEGGDRGPYTGSSTCGSCGVLQGTGVGTERKTWIIPGWFHLSVMEGHQKRGCGRECAGDRQKRGTGACLLVSVEDTRLVQNRSEPPHRLGTQRRLHPFYFLN